MPKQKSPSRPAKPKKYDFETPLDPFEGESLKGIAAFIESSPTLQSPAPPPQAAATTLPHSTQNTEDTYLAGAQDVDAISGTLDSSLEAESTTLYAPSPPAVLAKSDRLLQVSSVPDTNKANKKYIAVSRAHDTPITGLLVTSVSSSPDTIKTNTPDINSVRHTDEQSNIEAANNSCEPCELISGVSITSESSLPNTHELGIPITSELGSFDKSRNYINRQDKIDSTVSLGQFAPTVSDDEARVFVSSRHDINLTGPAVTFCKGVTNTHHSGISGRGEPDGLNISPPPQSMAIAGSITPERDDLSAESTTRGTGDEHPTTQLASDFLRSHNRGILSTAVPPEGTIDVQALTPAQALASEAQLRWPQASLPSGRTIFLKVQPATRGQDGLTKGEERVYTFLWRTVFGSKEHGRSDFKVVGDTIEISLRRLAQKVGLGLANCAWHVRCLEEKGCIVKVKESDHFHPAVYRIREFADIIQWRREHGLTHFIQRGHLAAFVDPSTGTPITKFRGRTCTVYRGKIVLSTPNINNSTVPIIQESGTPDRRQNNTDSSTPTVLDSSGVSVINSSTQLVRKNSSNKNDSQLTSSTPFSVPEDLITALYPLLPNIDDAAAFLLWKECQSRVPDCTVAEITHFVKVKAEILKSGRVQNPIGFLIAAVPKCFEGDSFQLFRQEQARLKEEQRRREEEERQKQQAIEEELNQYRREEEARGKAEKLLPTLPEEDRKGLYDQARAELSAKGYKASGLMMEKLLQEQVVRNLAKRLLCEA